MIEVFIILYKETDPVIVQCDNFTVYRGNFIYCWSDHKCIASFDLNDIYELSVKQF